MLHVDEVYVGGGASRPGRDVDRWREEVAERLVDEAAAVLLARDLAVMADALAEPIAEARRVLDASASEIGSPAEAVVEAEARVEEIRARVPDAQSLEESEALSRSLARALTERDRARASAAGARVRKTNAYKRLRMLVKTREVYAEAADVDTPLLDVLAEEVSP